MQNTPFQNITIETFPSLEEIKFKNIEKKYFKVILLNFFVLLLCSFIAAIIIDFMNLFGIEDYFFLIYFSLIILFGVVFFSYILGFKTRMYLVRDKDISYKSGLFFKKTTTVPFNRIQHLEIDQGLFSKLFQLASLSVFTAGDSSDDLKIGGISLIDAEKIKEFISSKIDG